MELITEYNNLSARDFAEQLLSDLKAAFGVDIRTIFEAPGLDDLQRLRQARIVLLDAIFSKAVREGYWHDWTADGPPDEEAQVERFFTGEVEIEPNISIIGSNLGTILGYRGEEIKTYLRTLAKRFENMTESKSAGQLAIELFAGGLLSVGVPMAYGAILAKLGGATLMAAIRAGVVSIGMKTAIGTVVVILVGFLYWLFWSIQKNALGLVINETGDHLLVKNWKKGTGPRSTGSDLYIGRGHMANFMVDHEQGLSSPEVQIRARYDFGPNDPDNVVFGGVYFANRNAGLHGAEGVMAFTFKGTPTRRVGVFFICPYTRSNGTYIGFATGAEETAEQMYNRFWNGPRVPGVIVKQDGYTLQSYVSSFPLGPEIGIISRISKDPA